MSKKSSRAKERREAREKQRRRNRQLTIAAVVGVIAVLLLVLVVVSQAPAEAPIPDDVAEKYEGLLTGETDAGFPQLGDPDAPVQLVEYSSFSCPACAVFHEDVFPQLIDDIRTGRINFTFVPYYISGGIANGEGAARAAVCAGEQGQFWEMHSVLFDWQTQYGNTAFSSQRLTAGASALGLDTGAFTNCFNSAETSAVLAQAIAESGIATPTIRVNGVEVENAQDINLIQQQIESAFAPFADDFVPLDERDAESQDTDSEETDETATEEAEAETPQAEMTEEADATSESDEPSEDAEATEEVDAEAPEATEEADSEAGDSDAAADDAPTEEPDTDEESDSNAESDEDDE